MLRILLTRRWLGALAAATVFCIVCLLLGRWQWGRHVDRSAAARAVEQHYSAPAVPLDAALPPGATLPDDQVWTRITATGTYERDDRLMVRNRPQNVTYGYEVLLPLRLSDGTALLVDRGWVKNGPTAEILPDVSDAPTGNVTVTGWLRQGEASLERNPPAGQLASINLDEAERATGQRLRGAYLVLQKEVDGSGHEPARPEPLLSPDTDTGPHFAYALQWWTGSLVGFVIVGVYLRREVRETQARRAGHAAADGTPAAAPARPKRVRIWDEEDE